MAKARSEFEDTYKWNVKDLYENEEDFLEELKYIETKLSDITKFKGHILESSKSLEDMLNLETDLSKRIEKAYIYGHINNDADTSDSKYIELFGKIKNTYTMFLETTSFIEPELLQSDYSVVENYIKENPALEEYSLSLKKIYRYKGHVLSCEEEKIISSFSEVLDNPEEVASSLTDTDLTFKSINVDGEEKELTESNYSIYIKCNNRNVRKESFENIHSKYGEFSNTLASTLRGEVKKNVVNAKLRNYKNSLSASLYSLEIEESVYHNLIESVHKNLKSLYKYWNLKKKLLNVSELHIYDAYADISVSDDKTYTYEEAEYLILTSLAPLGDTYINDLKKAFNGGWIDSCNNKGKRGGAYCTSCYSTHPYVLLSYEGKINSVSTLAHELGHAMHYYYAINNQNFNNYNYSIFVAEVASQVNELLLKKYLLQNSNNKNEKIRILDDLLQAYKSSIYRQTMFAEFELFIHEYTENGGILTADVMNDKYFALNKLYYGDDVVVDDLIKYEWARIPHFYMNFYVWQYATGFAASVKIANDIYNKVDGALDKYLEFLKLGNTKSPIDSLLIAGVDMNNSEVIDESIAYMDELIKEYEKLIEE